MKIVLLQQDIVWNDVEKNMAMVREAIAKAGEADLYVLPEMFLTGFVTEPQALSHGGSRPSHPCPLLEDGETIELTEGKIKNMLVSLLHTFLPLKGDGGAGECMSSLAGSVMVRTAEGWRNRLYFVKPDGEVVFYDKHHLFTYGGEHQNYTPGNERVVVEWKGVRFMLSVCYDLRFPVWLRNRGDYDCLLCVASWPESRRRVWDVLLQARAIENQCYVCGVNRVGSDPNCTYSGGTALIDARGKVVAQCPDGQASFVSCELDMEALRRFREKFPVLQDADAYSLNQ